MHNNHVFTDSKILMLELYQPFTMFRNPFTEDHPLTFPLPPRSTVIGMLQNLMNDPYGGSSLEKWENLQVYILGRYTAKFKHAVNLKKGKNFFYIIHNGVHKTIGISNRKANKSERGFDVLEELFNARFWIFLRGSDLIHVIAEKLLKNGSICLDKVLCLGRAEDIVFLERVRLFNQQDVGKDLKFYEQATVLLDNYGFYARLDDSMISNFSSAIPIIAPLHSYFYYEAKQNKKNPFKKRSEIFFFRNKKFRLAPKREVFFPQKLKKLYYIPPYSEVKNYPNNDNAKNKILKVRVSESSDSWVYLFEEGWLDGNS